MTVSSTISRSGPYLGNGVTTVFDYEFRILDASALQVIRRNADGTETVLTTPGDYAVSGVGADAGGQVTVAVAPAVGTTITILRDVQFTQELDLQNQGEFFADAIERALDASAMRDQQMQEELDRSVKVSASSNISDLNTLLANVQTIADMSDDVQTVAGNIGDVDTVATNMAAVQSVSTNMGDVITVALIAADVQTVADNAPSVEDVADNMAAVLSAQTNLPAIIAAPAQAAAAAQSAVDAANAAASVGNASTIVVTPSIGGQSNVQAALANQHARIQTLEGGLLHVQDRKPGGTSGGTFTSGDYRTRDLNTVLVNTIAGASLAANLVTLPAGTYEVSAWSMAWFVNDHKLLFGDITNAVTLAIGPTHFSPAAETSGSPFGDAHPALVRGIFTLSGVAQCALRHRCATTRADTGFGRAVSSFGVQEVFSDLLIRKIG